MDTTQISFFKDEGKDELRTLYCKDALYRSSYIHDVKYRIAYALLPGGKTFHGSVQISFELDEIPSENTFREITLRARVKCKIESLNGKSTLTSAEANSYVQSRNI